MGKRFAVRISRDDDITLYEIISRSKTVVLYNPNTKSDIVISNEDFKKHYKEVSV